jgi:hypothetical protein
MHQGDKVGRWTCGTLKKSKSKLPNDPFPEGLVIVKQQHDLAKEFSYGTRLALLSACCQEEKCADVKPQIDINTTRVASQHKLIKTNLRIHPGHNRYVVKYGSEARVSKLAVAQEQWKEAAEMEAVLANVTQLTTIAQHERVWTGAFDVLVGRRFIQQSKPESKLDCIPLDGDMNNIKRVAKVAEKVVGEKAQARAYAEAGRRFG